LSLLSYVASALKVTRGMLIEYTIDSKLLVLDFEFNPSSITRTRTVQLDPDPIYGRGGNDFKTPMDAMKAMQGAITSPESFSIKILLDATDRMNAGDPIASAVGVQPEIDVLRAMLEPKSPLPSGAKTLAALGVGGGKGFPEYRALPVLLFKWGVHMLPVCMTKAQIEHQAFLPWLTPYRAEATLELRVLESDNPFYNWEAIRQSLSAVVNMRNVSISTFVPGL